MDFQRAVLNRIPSIASQPEEHWRPIVFICDEYQHFAAVGENEPSGVEKFFTLSRQAKCIPLVATQSISSLKTTLPGKTWRVLLQTFRTKIFLAFADDFSATVASELCGKTPIRAAAIRPELERNKVASVRTSLDDVVVEKFCYARP